MLVMKIDYLICVGKRLYTQRISKNVDSNNLAK